MAENKKRTEREMLMTARQIKQRRRAVYYKLIENLEEEKKKKKTWRKIRNREMAQIRKSYKPKNIESKETFYLANNLTEAEERAFCFSLPYYLIHFQEERKEQEKEHRIISKYISNYTGRGGELRFYDNNGIELLFIGHIRKQLPSRHQEPLYL